MADINISERQAGDVTVLDLEGKVTIGEGSVTLRNAIRRLLGEGKTRSCSTSQALAISIRAASASLCRALRPSRKRAELSSFST